MEVVLSVVVPMYNEEANARQAIARLTAELHSIGKPYEILCVNDGSTDATPSVIEEESERDHRVHALHLSRNFGKESALAAGLEAADGDAVIILDADLQHPPELISQMVTLWEQGNDIVQAKKVGRGRESFIYRCFSKVFYRIVSSSMGKDMTGASDFGLLDRQVVDQIIRLPERVRFLRGLVSWVGFNTASLEYEVADRKEGRSRWSTTGLIRYAFKNILAFTTFPLYATAVVGLLITLAGVGLGVQTLYNWATGVAVSGFTTVILLNIFFAGFTILSIGVVAVYLASVIAEVKGRPVFILRSPENRRKKSDSQSTRNADPGDDEMKLSQ